MNPVEEMIDSLLNDAHEIVAGEYRLYGSRDIQKALCKIGEAISLRQMQHAGVLYLRPEVAIPFRTVEEFYDE